jgi:hypothetical protein
MDKHQAEEQAAKVVGVSRTSMKRIKFIRDAADDEDLPAEVRDLAKAECAKLSAGVAKVMPSYRAVKAAWRRHGLVWVGNCASCGTRIEGRRPDARYCSNACRQRAYRHRS